MNLSIKNNYINRILEREKLLLWFIFSLGLLLRIAFIIIWDRRPNFDTQNYIAQAEAILTGNPASGFPNGYPLIIAAVIFLTGKNLIFPVMISLNLLAQFLTGYFLYKITKLLFPESPNYPTTNNQQPTTNNQQPSTNNHHPTTNNQQPITNNQQPITNNQQPITNNQQPITNNQQPITNNQQPTTNNQQLTTNNQQPITNNQQPITNNQQLTTILVLFLFALYPTQILYTNSVLTETITTLFITASVYGIINNSYFLGGLTLAIASMIRTSFLPALIITFLYILYTYTRTNQKSNQHPITNNQHPITNTQHPTPNTQQPITNNQQPITNNQQPITNNQQPITNNHHPITNNQQPITNTQQPITNNQQPISNPCVQTNSLKNIITNEKLLLWFIFSLGLLLRIAFIIIWDRRPNFDTQNYIAQAEAILNGNPASGFPNGYPLIIAAVIFLTGKNLIFPAMISLNLLAQFFTGYFLYKITKILSTESVIETNPKNKPLTTNHEPLTTNHEPLTTNHEPLTTNHESLITNHQPLTTNHESLTTNHESLITNHQSLITTLVLFLFAIYPTQILYTNSVLTETITTLFITASVYGIINNSYFLGGLSLAIASMIRTSFLPALIITFLYILYKYIRTNQQSNQQPITNNQQPITNNHQPITNNHQPITNNQQPITNNQQPITNNQQPITNNHHPITNNQQPITNNQQPITNNHHPITQSPYMKYLAGLAIVIAFFALLDISSVTKFPNNQNYSLLLAINKSPSEATLETKSNIQTYIDFASSNSKEFISQRASSFWALWGVFPLEINNLLIRFIFSIRIFLFLSWVYWLYIFIRKKEQSLFKLYFIPLSIIMLTITIIHTFYFSSSRYIVPLEPLLLIICALTVFKFPLITNLSPDSSRRNPDEFANESGNQ